MLNVSLGGQEGAGITGFIEWDRMELNAVINLDLRGRGFKLPAGRGKAETLLEDEYLSLIHPVLLGVQADSSATVEDLIKRGELSLQTADRLALEARRVPPSLSPDLEAISGRYTLSLSGIAAALIRHSRPRTIQGPLIPSPARAYTGIIIIADEEVPVHGRQTKAFPKPCLFPKIWDSRMNLIYERDMTDPELSSVNGMVRYISRGAIMGASPSGIDGSLIPLIGENPLRIMAGGVFGVEPTDPVISEEDALIILSSESNRRLLREGRVAIVLNRESLKKPIAPPRAR
jgi:hypothetical protein